MKTRIKIIELKNGTKLYVPQARPFGIAITLAIRILFIFICVPTKSLYCDIDNDGSLSFGENKCSTKEEAQKAIDLYLNNEEEIRGKELKEVTYIKYP